MVKDNTAQKLQNLKLKQYNQNNYVIRIFAGVQIFIAVDIKLL